MDLGGIELPASSMRRKRSTADLQARLVTEFSRFFELQSRFSSFVSFDLIFFDPLLGDLFFIF